MKNPNGRKTYLLPWKQGPSEGRNQTERMEQNEREREVNGMEGGREREREIVCAQPPSARRRISGVATLAGLH